MRGGATHLQGCRPSDGLHGLHGLPGLSRQGLWLLGDRLQDRGGGDPAATWRDPRGLPGAAPRGSASVLTRASARGSAISPCGTSWRRPGNRRPVAPGASRSAGTMDRGRRAPAAGGGGATGVGRGRGRGRRWTEGRD